MKRQRLALPSLAASAFVGAGAADAASRITGMDLYGHGVVTAAEPFAPPVGTKSGFHIILTLWDPFVGNPYPAIPTDATGTFHYSTIGGPWGFEVGIRDVGGFGACEVCDANFSLLDGALTGPFSFDAGVDPTHYMSVTNTSFWGLALAPDFSTRAYSGTFALDSYVIHTDAPIPVPEPTSWMLMIAGFLGVGLALRSSAKRSRLRTSAPRFQ